MKILKKEIHAFLSPLYRELLTSDKQTVEVIFHGVIARAGKSYQRFGRVAWRACYSFTLPNGKNTGYQWDTLAGAVDGLVLWLKAEKL